jgi:hypothetical protein
VLEPSFMGPISVSSCEQVASTDIFVSVVPISSVRTSFPVVASQILTVESRDPDATSFESPENATEQTLSRWPSSVCTQGLQLLSIIGLVIIHFGSSFSNVFRITL